MTETGSRLLLGVAAVLAGTTVLLGVFGLVYTPVLLLAALPFAAATYFLWGSATGRLDARMRERVHARRVEEEYRPFGGGATPGPGAATGGGRARGPGVGPDPRDRGFGAGAGASAGRGPGDRPGEPNRSASAAASVLGVEPGADQSEVRRAFRERARELHPDAPDGDEAAFRRVRSAYERLSDGD